MELKFKNGLSLAIATITIICNFCALCPAQTSFSASPGQYLSKTLNTSISGIVHHPTEKLVQISYHKNSFNFNLEQMLLPVADDGSFQVDFDLTDAAELKLTYDGVSTPLYVQKGDNLQLEFDGTDFLKTVHCQGRGAKNNDFLIASTRAFQRYDQGYILYKISQNEAEDYKKLIEGITKEKIDFYNSYSNADKAKMTPDFKEYILADYTYWGANQLLNYRMERPLLIGEAAPLDLSVSYYDFLKDLNFRENVVLSNKNYCEFLEEFLKLKGDLAAKEKSLNYAQKVVTQENMLINESGNFVHMNVGDRISILNESDSELNREAIATVLPAFDVKSLDYIKLEDGTKGWVRNLSAGTLVEEETDTAAEGRIKKYAICRKHNAKLLKSPLENEVVTALGYGEEVNYLHLKSSESFEYNFNGVDYYGKLVKVENQRGQQGWLLESFIDVLEKKVYEEENPSAYLYSLTGTDEARQYLEGQALYYSLAKALYWKIKLDEGDDIAREIAAFASHNDYKVFHEILRAEYDVEQLRKKRSDDYIETYAYSNLKSPVIAGVKIGLPFDKSAFVSATKAQAKKTYVEISNVLADRPSSAVKLSGKIAGGLLKKASLTIVYDFISYQEEVIPLDLDQQGNYAINKELKDPVLAILQCGNKTMNLYLYPGDNINVDFNANNFPNSVNFEGKSSALNTYLFEEQKVFETQLASISGNSERMNADDFADFAKNLYKKRKQHFDKYKKKNSVSSHDALFINSNMRYHYASMLFNYEDIQVYIQNKNTVDLPKNFYAPIQDLPISVEGVLPNMNYVDFIHQFLDYQSAKVGNESMNKIDIAKQYFSGEVLAYIEAKDLATMCQIGKAYEYGQSIRKYLNSNNYLQYNDVLRTVYNEQKPIQTGDIAPDFNLTDIDGQEVRLSNLRGKVVYIDLWATWCRPCIKSMTYSQRLIEKYGEEDVVFLYVNMDEKTNLWQDYVASQDLKGIQLHAKSGSGYLSDIAKLYKVKQLPTFVIIDKNGKISFNKAGSPGSKVVSNLIDGLLETPRF